MKSNYDKEYYQKNKEAKKAKRRAHYKKNKSVDNERSKQYRLDHKKEIQEYDRLRYKLKREWSKMLKKGCPMETDITWYFDSPNYGYHNQTFKPYSRAPLDGRPPKDYVIEPVELLTHEDKDGYLRLSIRINGKTKCMFLHKFIWQAKNGRNKTYGTVIHHKDFDKLNNNPDNLEEITRTKHHAIHKRLKKEHKMEMEQLQMKGATSE